MIQTAFFGLLGVLFLKLGCVRVAARLRAGTDDGGKPAAGDAAVAWRPDDVPHPPYLRRLAGRRRAAGAHRAAEHAQKREEVFAEEGV